jgi:hypothetical protein
MMQPLELQTDSASTDEVHFLWSPSQMAAVHVTPPPDEHFAALDEEGDRRHSARLEREWFRVFGAALWLGKYAEAREIVRQQRSSTIRVWSVDHEPGSLPVNARASVPCKKAVVMSVQALERVKFPLHEVVNMDEECWVYLELRVPRGEGCAEQASTGRITAAAEIAVRDLAEACSASVLHSPWEHIEVDIVTLLRVDAAGRGVGRRVILKPYVVAGDRRSAAPLKNPRLAKAVAELVRHALHPSDGARIRSDVYDDGVSLLLWRPQFSKADVRMASWSPSMASWLTRWDMSEPLCQIDVGHHTLTAVMHCERLSCTPVPTSVAQTLVHPLLASPAETWHSPLIAPPRVVSYGVRAFAGLLGTYRQRFRTPPPSPAVFDLNSDSETEMECSPLPLPPGGLPPPSSPASPTAEPTAPDTPETRDRRPPERYTPLLLRRNEEYRLGSSPSDLAWAHTWVQHGVRPGVHAKRTTILGLDGQPLRQQGLFTPSDRGVPKGALLALVHGEITSTLSTWAMAVDDGVLVGPTDRDISTTGNARRWLTSHPWARINEPVSGTTANAVIFAWYKASDVTTLGTKSCRVLCWAIHAAEQLPPGHEIFLHYSPLKTDDYAPVRQTRGYECGEPARPLSRADIPEDESPAAVFGCYTLRTAVF